MTKFRWGVLVVLLLLGVVLYVAVQQWPVRLMPTPAVFLKSEHELFATDSPLDEQGSDIQVFFATNRAAVGPQAARVYTIFPGDDLHLGTATLSVGGIGYGWDWLREQSLSAEVRRRPPILLRSMDEAASFKDAADIDAPDAATLAFLRSIDDALAGSADPNLTVYVHGANTGIVRATGQAAQLRHFTGRHSVVLSYLWPSAESFLRFSHDVEHAGRTAPAFARLLRLLAAHTRAERINVIGYSSGAMVVSPALAQLGRGEDGVDPRALRLGEVYFPAPDADFRQFVAALGDFSKVPDRVTVMANMNDSVLQLSRLHQRGSRAGRPDPDELDEETSRWLVESSLREGFDLIQVRASDLPGMNPRSHVFWYEDPRVSSDILIQLLFQLRPQDRGLQHNEAGSGLEYWTFPSDYEQRLGEVMARLATGAAVEAEAEAEAETPAPATAPAP